jgi:hypothetical protein
MSDLFTITHPCGHVTSFDDACYKRDHFRCGICGLNWHMQQDPPIVYPSGWIMPGKRHVVIEPQGDLPVKRGAA